MTRKTSLCLAVAAVLSLSVMSDAEAFFGSRGSCGSWGGSSGSWGSGGSWGGGSWGSGGSHGGGILRRIFRGSHGSHGGYSSCGSHGGYASNGSHGGYATFVGNGYYASTQPQVTYAVAKQTPAVKTQLTLRVPSDAKVTLAGVATKAPTEKTGEVRQYTTTRLADGQTWDNYQVVVETIRDGRTVREERTITLTGGQAQELTIGVPVMSVAQTTP
jgi:uncharacterized protein (TIGR03000 family)